MTTIDEAFARRASPRVGRHTGPQYGGDVFDGLFGPWHLIILVVVIFLKMSMAAGVLGGLACGNIRACARSSRCHRRNE